MKYYLFLIISFFFILQSCKKNELEVIVDDSLEYAPFEVGYRWTYQMDSMVFHGNGAATDTFSFQTRHEVVERVQNEDELLYVVDMSYKSDSNASWRYGRTYGIRVRSDDIIKTEFNQAEIVLSLPITKDKFWDGNSFNNQPEALYYIQSAHLPTSINGFSYDSVAVVVQEEQINLVNSFQGEEIYAKGVGLVSKFKERLTNLINPEQIDGYSYRMTLLSFEQ